MASIELDSSLVLAILLGIFSYLLMVMISSRRSLRSGSPVLPSPPALPIIGNLHQLGRGHHHRKLQALARRHGPLFLLRLGAVPPTLVVSSAAVAEEVLRAQDHVFCGRPRQHTARRISYDYRDVGFSPYGERWRRLRRVAVVHLLSVRRVDSFRALREKEVASLVARVARIAAARQGRGGINVSELVVSLTYTVISRSAFGNKLGGMDPGTVREMLKDVTVLLETIAVGDLFPRLRWVDRATGLDARIERTARKLDAIFERVLVEHEKKSSTGEPGDLLDDLLSVVNEGGEGSKLDRTDVKGLILVTTYSS